MMNDEKTRVGLRVTIYPRGKKRIYVADFHANGRHCRKSLATANKKTATRRAIEIEHELASGKFNPESKPKELKALMTGASVEDACRDYVAFLKTEGRRPKTVSKYRGILSKFAEFAVGVGATELSRVNLQLIDKYRQEQQALLSPKSMCHEGSLKKRFFTWCVERQLMLSNPLAVRKFRAPKPKPRGGPTLEQIDQILRAATKARHPIIAVAAFAGMRIGEIMRLQVADVDFADNWLRIESRPNLETKSGDSWKVPIHPRLRKILERLPHGKTGCFFTAQPSHRYPQGGRPFKPDRVNDDFTKILNQLGIPSGRKTGFTFHSLRASFKTICINSGIPKEVVDVWQNHAPDRAASHVYYKLSDQESQRFIRTAQFGEE